MSYQHDPDQPTRTPMGYRRGTEGFGLIPVIAGAVFLILFGIMLFGPDSDTRQSNVRTDDSTRPADQSPTNMPSK